MRSQFHKRQSYRLRRYDYSSSGAYFVTICAYQKQNLFGEIENGHVKMNRIGRIIEEEWFKTACIRSEILLDEYVIMPNHFHGIVWIRDRVGAHGNAPMDDPIDESAQRGALPCAPTIHNLGPLRRPHSLSTWVAGFKSATTHRIRQQKLEFSVWQRNYHDRIIRNENELKSIRWYIKNNPKNWEGDELSTECY